MALRQGLLAGAQAQRHATNRGLYMYALITRLNAGTATGRGVSQFAGAEALAAAEYIGRAQGPAETRPPAGRTRLVKTGLKP